MNSTNQQDQLLEKQFELFDQVLEMDEAARLELLAAVGKDNPTLRAEVERLLVCHEQPNSDFLEMTRAAPAASIGSTSAEVLPQGYLIGKFKILQLIGEGGMGQVYMAEQMKGIRRRVALKLIHSRHSSKNFSARFDAEREALSRLDHPNIARILDAGQMENGRSYFVMELLKGASLLEYCDREKLKLDQRLQLMESVCRAIHHAHQKGIIHRDIKPSNLLVTIQDGKATAKVIDFGIAKALDQPLVDQTMFTKFGELIGTPEYMSPEQLESGGVDLDIRSDIYSLGVVLYQLLTGKLPFEMKVDQSLLKRLDELRNSEPIRPSLKMTQAITADVGTVEQIASKRRLNPVGLQKYLCGDLDWITLKALAKTRGERFESAAALANDIHRFLNQEPVEAAAPSWHYKARKLVQKHQAVFLIAGLSLLALIGSTIFSTYLAISSGRAKNLLQEQSVELQEQVKLSKQLEVRAVEAERKAVHLARDHMNEAVTEKAISRYIFDSLTRANSSTATFAMLNEFRGSDENKTNMVLPSYGSSRILFDPSKLSADERESLGGLKNNSNRITDFEDLPVSIQQAIKDKLSNMEKSPSDAAPTASLKLRAEDISKEDLARNRLRLLKLIQEEQENEFGADDEFVGLTLLRIAETYLQLGESLEGQLAVHKAINILKPEHSQRCQELLSKLNEIKPAGGQP